MKTSCVSIAFYGLSFCFTKTSYFDEGNIPRTNERKTRMKKTTLTLAILGFGLFLSSIAIARPGNDAVDSVLIRARTMADSGYVTWKKDTMLQAYGLLQLAAADSPGNKYVEYYQSYTAYRLMTYGVVMKDDQVYKEFSDRAEKTAASLSRRYPDWAEAKILLASIYGIEIAHNWINAPTLGPKSNDLAEKAVSLDSTNPRAYLILGTDKLNTPAIFGGSVDKAVECFRKSISLFRSEPASAATALEPSWGYIDALTWLGLAYEKQGRYNEALAEYREALAVAPDYGRARYVLIPGVEKEIDSKYGK